MPKQKSKADYSFETKEVHGIKFCLIEDLNLGNTSVTNDIENVVEEINQVTDISDHIILYKDSDGSWDGWSEKNGFFFVNAKSDEEAMFKYAKLISI